MTRKDRNIHFFLILFLLSIGVFMTINGTWQILNIEQDLLFDFENKQLPIFTFISELLIGLVCVLSAVLMWMRVHWAYGLVLFTSGLLIAFNLTNLGYAISQNPYNGIIMVVILIIVLQSLPFLIRKNQRL